MTDKNEVVDVKAEEVTATKDEYEGLVVNLSFAINDLRVIYQLLGKLPMDVAEPVVNLLRAQVTPQLEKFKEEQNAKAEEKVGGDKPDKK